MRPAPPDRRRAPALPDIQRHSRHDLDPPLKTKTHFFCLLSLQLFRQQPLPHREHMDGDPAPLDFLFLTIRQYIKRLALYEIIQFQKTTHFPLQRLCGLMEKIANLHRHLLLRDVEIHLYISFIIVHLIHSIAPYQLDGRQILQSRRHAIQHQELQQPRIHEIILRRRLSIRQLTHNILDRKNQVRILHIRHILDHRHLADSKTTPRHDPRETAIRKRMTHRLSDLLQEQTHGKFIPYPIPGDDIPEVDPLVNVIQIHPPRMHINQFRKRAVFEIRIKSTGNRRLPLHRQLLSRAPIDPQRHKVLREIIRIHHPHHETPAQRRRDLPAQHLRIAPRHVHMVLAVCQPPDKLLPPCHILQLI